MEFLTTNIDLLAYAAAGLVSLSGLGYLVFRKKPTPPPPAPTPTEAKAPSAPKTAVEPTAPPMAKAPARKEYKSLNEALARTREGFWGRVKGQFAGKSSISKNELEDLEEALYTSDLGPKTVDHLIRNMGAKLNGSDYNIEQLQDSLKSELQSIFLNTAAQELSTAIDTPTTVWMIVGVNGAGKTTTIGKLASQQVAKGKRVLIAAGDTFRAAADAQLKVWADRSNVEIFSPEGIKDPSAVAFDAVQMGVAKKFDLIIIDTAGRLHTQKNLMEELKKMKRVITKALPGAPHETLLVLDANSGQNALMQTEQFHEALQVSGVILTKMDGSAKGGVAVGIACEHQLPIKMIGVGEKIEDLRPFNSQEFINSII